MSFTAPSRPVCFLILSHTQERTLADHSRPLEPKRVASLPLPDAFELMPASIVTRVGKLTECMDRCILILGRIFLLLDFAKYIFLNVYL